MSQIEDIFEVVLGEIIPTSQDLKFISEIISLLNTLLRKKAKELNINFTKMEAQGSTGIKQTQLRNDFDIDFFIGLNYDQFNLKHGKLSKTQFKKEIKKEFRRLCVEWIIEALNAKKFSNHRLLYAEHPYVTVDYVSNQKKVLIDIVLYFDLPLEYIKEKGPITAVDRSPWHGRFIQNNLTLKQKNDVRLLKQFFKACHSYGDKSPVGKIGFIGYSAELLIYFYGSLLSLFENFHALKQTPLDYYKRTKKQLREIPHFQNDSLLIIDPIDQNRNVASAISEKAYNYCNYRIKQFLKNPKKEYFDIIAIPQIDLTKDKGLLSKLFIIESEAIDETSHYTILRDKLYFLGDNIQANGEKEHSHDKKFGNLVFEVVFEEKLNEFNLAIFCESPEISKTYLRRGPPLKENHHAQKFKSKNLSFIKKDGYLWVETEREHHIFINFLEDHLKKQYVDKNISQYLKISNISQASNAKKKSARQALYVLKKMVLPFTS